MVSPSVAARFSTPTGPPSNFLIIACIRTWSNESNPLWSISSDPNAFSELSLEITESDLTWAKSLTLLRSLFAILGVPLDLFAISNNPVSVNSHFKSLADLSKIFFKSLDS